MSTMIAQINTLVAEQLGGAAPSSSTLPTNISDPTSQSALQADIEAAGLTLYVNSFAANSSATGLTSQQLQTILSMAQTLLSNPALSATQKEYLNDLCNAIQHTAGPGFNWNTFCNAWQGISGATPSQITQAIGADITAQIASAGGTLSLPPQDSDQRLFMFGLAIVSAENPSPPYYFSNATQQSYADAAVSFLNDYNLLPTEGGATFSNSSFSTDFDNAAANPSALPTQATLASDITTALNAPNPLQDNIEAAGLLLYLDKLVSTYPAPPYPNQYTSSSLQAILQKINTLLQQLNSTGNLSPTFAGYYQDFQKAMQFYNTTGSGTHWQSFASGWATNMKGNGVTSSTILQQIQQQIQAAGGTLTLPTAGNGQDATFIFALSMLAAYDPNSTYFSGSAADGNSATELYASAMANFFIDQGGKQLLWDGHYAPIVFDETTNDVAFSQYYNSYASVQTNPISESVVNADIAQLLAAPPPHPTPPPNPTTTVLQNNLEAAGILVYLHQIIQQYGQSTSNTATLINITTALISQLDALNTQGGLSETLQAAITQANKAAGEYGQPNTDTWSNFVSTWHTQFQGTTYASVLSDIQSQLGSTPLTQLTSDGNMSPELAFGLSMVEIGLNSGQGGSGLLSLSNETASGYTASYLLASLASQFLKQQDVSIPLAVTGAGAGATAFLNLLASGNIPSISEGTFTQQLNEILSNYSSS